MGQIEEHHNQRQDLAASLGDAADELSSTVEKRVGEILQSAEKQAASIEEEAAGRARELERRAQESERLMQALEKVDRLAETVGRTLDDMRRELRAAIAERGPLERLEEELAPPPPAPALPPRAPEPAAIRPEPPAPQAAPPASQVPGADPELDKLIRKQIKAMLDEGKSRAEAAEYLTRFNMGKSYLGVIDELYWSEERQPASGRRITRRLRNKR